jgi:SAM-dependent methyltransferase
MIGVQTTLCHRRARAQTQPGIGAISTPPFMSSPEASRPRTAPANGRLWGAQAADWAEIQEGQFRPGYEAVFQAAGLRAAQAICDVGCGSGMAAQIAADHGAKVAGLDASESLLAIARSRVPEGDFRLGEMEELPFPDAAFDLVTGFNSFQYAGNPVAALAEARRVTRAGGQVVVMTWGPPAGMEAATLVAAMRPLLPPPPPGAPGPFALSDAAALRAFAVEAGLTPSGVTDVSCAWNYPDLPTALRGLGSSGVAMRARDHSGAAAVDAAHEAALAPFRRADGSYRIAAAFRWLMAGV